MPKEKPDVERIVAALLSFALDRREKEQKAREVRLQDPDSKADDKAA